MEASATAQRLCVSHPLCPRHELVPCTYTPVRTTTKKALDRLSAMTLLLTALRVIDTLAVPHGIDAHPGVAAHRPGRADPRRCRACLEEVGLESAQRWTDHPL